MGKIKVGDGESEPESIHWCSPLWMTDGAAEIFRAGGSEGIDLDPCPNPGSIPRIKAKQNYLLSDGLDGLKTPWRGDKTRGLNGNAWVNPPFGRYFFNPTTQAFLSPKEVKQRVSALIAQGPSREEAQKQVLDGFESHSIKEWIQLCETNAVQNGMDILQVGPASVGSSWFQNHIDPTAAAILYIRGRVKYELVDFKTMQVLSLGNSAPMDCTIALWTQKPAVLEAFKKQFAGRGTIRVKP